MQKVIYTRKNIEENGVIVHVKSKETSFKPYWVIYLENGGRVWFRDNPYEPIQMNVRDKSDVATIKFIPRQKAEFVNWVNDFATDENPRNDEYIYGIGYLDEDGVDVQDYVWFKTKAERYKSMVEDCLEIVNCNPNHIDIGDKVIWVNMEFFRSMVKIMFVGERTENGIKGNFVYVGDINSLASNVSELQKFEYNSSIDNHEINYLLLPYEDSLDFSYIPLYRIIQQIKKRE